MPLKRSPAATVYEVGLTRKRKGEGAGERELGGGREGKGREEKNLEEASYPNRAPPQEESRFISLGLLASVPKGISTPKCRLSPSFYLFSKGWGRGGTPHKTCLQNS